MEFLDVRGEGVRFYTVAVAINGPQNRDVNDINIKTGFSVSRGGITSRTETLAQLDRSKLKIDEIFFGESFRQPYRSRKTK